MLNFHLLKVFEGRTFTVINRLSGGECASALLARRKHVRVGSAKSSMISKAKTALTPLPNASSIGLHLIRLVS
jgi:hypothetical protein